MSVTNKISSFVVKVIPNQTTYDLKFTYNTPTDIKIFVNGIRSSAFTIDKTKITFTGNISTNDVIRVRRITAKTQTTSYSIGSAPTSNVLESSIDKLTYITQELEEAGNGVIRVSGGYTAKPFPSKDARKNTVIGFDALGEVQLLPIKFYAGRNGDKGDTGATIKILNASLVTAGSNELEIKVRTGTLRSNGDSRGVIYIAKSVYDTQNKLDITNGIKVKDPDKGDIGNNAFDFNITIGSLNLNTDYVVRAYYTLGANTSYSEGILNVKTLSRNVKLVTWTPPISHFHAVRYDSILLDTRDYLYSVGGSGASYNGSNNVLIQRVTKSDIKRETAKVYTPNFALPPNLLASAIIKNNIIYVFGGDTSTPSFSFDIKTSTFKKLSPMPVNYFKGGIGLDGDLIHLIGGRTSLTNTAYTPVHYTYNPYTDKFALLKTPTITEVPMGMNKIGGVFYIQRANGYYSYDIKTKVWSNSGNYTGASATLPSKEYLNPVLVGSTLYLLGASLYTIDNFGSSLVTVKSTVGIPTFTKYTGVDKIGSGAGSSVVTSTGIYYMEKGLLGGLK